MKKAVVVFCAVVISLANAQGRSNSTPQETQPVSPPILGVNALHPGMKGVAYTVFDGTKPEAMGRIHVYGARSRWARSGI